MMILQGNLHNEAFESIPAHRALYDVDKMLTRAKRLQGDSIPATFGRDSFVFVYHPTTAHVYCFPGMESENLDNDAARVKEGVAFFVAKGFVAYSDE